MTPSPSFASAPGPPTAVTGFGALENSANSMLTPSSRHIGTIDPRRFPKGPEVPSAAPCTQTGPQPHLGSQGPQQKYETYTDAMKYDEVNIKREEEDDVDLASVAELGWRAFPPTGSA